MNNPLSYNDPDLNLARRIGGLLDSGLPVTEELQGEADWLDTLLTLKRDVAASVSGLGSGSDLNSASGSGSGSVSDLSSGSGSGLASGLSSGSGLEWDEIERLMLVSDTLNTNSEAQTGTTTRVRPRKPARNQTPLIHSMTSFPVWLSAAAVLLIAFIGGIVLYMTTVSGPAVIESADSIVEFEAPDGSLITLRPYSRLKQVAHGDGVLAYSIEGEAYFEVVPDAGREFRVNAGNGTVTVLGTRFTARNTGEESRVYLHSGSVRLVSAATRDSIVLEPGFEVVVGQDGIISEPAHLTPEEGIGWIYRQLNFVMRPAEWIFAELGHHFNIQIAYPDEIADETVTGRILLDDRQLALDDAGIALGGHFELRNDGSYVFISD